MNEIIHYFETIPSLHRALLLAGGIAFFWLTESIKPLVNFEYRKWKHAGINIFLYCNIHNCKFLDGFYFALDCQLDR